MAVPYKEEKSNSFASSNIRVFPRRLTHGGLLTIGYCFRTIGYCFPYCFLEINFCGGDKALMEGDKVVMGDPQSPH